MWESSQADTPQRLRKIHARHTEQPVSPMTESHAQLRAEINRLLAAGQIEQAADRYRILLAEVPGNELVDTDAAATEILDPMSATVLAEQGQLDVASQLYSQGDHADAARAYELLIQSYPTSTKADEVRLILGLLYARHLALPQRARELIEKARPRLREESQARLADQLLAELAT